MDQGNMDQAEKIVRRLDNVEMALSHLQNDYQALNETLLLVSGRYDKLQSQFEQLATRIKTVSAPHVPRPIEDEKPPHY